MMPTSSSLPFETAQLKRLVESLKRNARLPIGKYFFKQESATNVASNFQSWLSEFYPELLDDYLFAGQGGWRMVVQEREASELRRRDERHNRLASAFIEFYGKCPWGREFNGVEDDRCFSGYPPWWDRSGFWWHDREEGADIRESRLPPNELSYYLDHYFNNGWSVNDLSLPSMEYFSFGLDGHIEGLIRELYFTSNDFSSVILWNCPFEFYDDDELDTDGFPLYGQWELEKTVVLFACEFCGLDYRDLRG